MKKFSLTVMLNRMLVTCVALAKAGLVVGPLRPSVCPFVCSSVRPSVRLSATLLGCLVCVICNSNSFHTFIFKLCPLGSWVSLWNFETIKGSLMKPKWQKLASLAEKICTLWFLFFGAVFASKG